MLVGIQIGQQTFEPPQIARELNEFEGCVFPCWKTITPNETTIAHANRLIQGAGYTNTTSPTMIADGRFFYNLPDIWRCKLAITSERARVSQIRLYDCPPTRIGDLIRYLGEPEGIVPDRFGLVFRGGKVMVYSQRIVCEERFTPNTFIGVIEMRNEPPSDYYEWRGFINLQNYMQRNEVVGLNC
jgi:hypothetical protein